MTKQALNGYVKKKKPLGTFSNDNCDIFKAFDASDAHIQQET